MSFRACTCMLNFSGGSTGIIISPTQAMHFESKFPQNDHRFASSLIPPKWVPWKMTPAAWWQQNSLCFFGGFCGHLKGYNPSDLFIRLFIIGLYPHNSTYNKGRIQRSRLDSCGFPLSLSSWNSWGNTAKSEDLKGKTPEKKKTNCCCWGVWWELVLLMG